MHDPPTYLLLYSAESLLTRTPTKQEEAVTVKSTHSFLRCIETLRDLLTPLSKKPTSRVPHSMLWALFGVPCPMPSPSRAQSQGHSSPRGTHITKGEESQNIAIGTRER